MNNKIVLFIFILFVAFSKRVYTRNIDNFKIYTEDYPPYNFMVDGVLNGVAVDLMEQMLNDLGSTLTRKDIKLIPWARAYVFVQNNKNSILFSTTRTKHRENLFKWVGPIITTKFVLIGLKKKMIEIKNAEGIKKFKITVVRKDISEQLLYDEGVPKKNVLSVSKAKSCILLLLNGRVDLWSYEETVAKWQIKKIKKDPKEFVVVHVFKTGKLYYAFNLDTSAVLVNKFQNSLNKLKKTKVYHKILNKYVK